MTRDVSAAALSREHTGKVAVPISTPSGAFRTHFLKWGTNPIRRTLRRRILRRYFRAIAAGRMARRAAIPDFHIRLTSPGRPRPSLRRAVTRARLPAGTGRYQLSQAIRAAAGRIMMADAAAAPVPAPGLGTKLFYGLGSVAFGIKDARLRDLSAHLLQSGAGRVGHAGQPRHHGRHRRRCGVRSDHRRDLRQLALAPGPPPSLHVCRGDAGCACSISCLWNPPHWSSGALFGYLMSPRSWCALPSPVTKSPAAALAPELSQRLRPAHLADGVSLSLRRAWRRRDAHRSRFVFFLVRDARHSRPASSIPHGYFTYSVHVAAVAMIGQHPDLGRPARIRASNT